MLITSFENILKEIYGEDGVKEAVGGIRSLDTFLNNDNLKSIERQLPHWFYCLLLHDSRTDKTIQEYIETGSLSSDVGENVLCLFITSASCSLPRLATALDFQFGLELQSGSHPSSILASSFFAKPCIIPGLIFCSSLIERESSLFISLAGIDSLERTTHLLRLIFRICNDISEDLNSKKLTQSTQDRLNELAIRLAKGGIAYNRTGTKPFKELLIQAFSFARKHKGDLATIVSLL